VEFMYTSGALDVEIEDPANPGKGGRTSGTCGPGCNVCCWHEPSNPLWTPVYVIPANAPKPTMPAPGPTAAQATATMKSVWAPKARATVTSIDRRQVRCTGRHCPDPFNPYAEPNQPDGSFKCYSCRSGVLR
jgi:hypothetical protein